MPRHRLVLVPLVPLVLISLLASSFAQRNPVSPDDLAPVKGSIGHGQQTAGGPGFVGQSPPPRHGQSGRAATEGTVWQERVFGSRRARHPAAISAIQKVQPAGPIFEAAAVFSTGGNNAESLVTSDFNGDGKLDLVIANQCASGNSDCNGSVAVLLGKGDGSFQSPVSYGSGGNRAFSVVVADVNGDGKPDLIVANGCITDGSFCENGTGGAVGVLLGNGDGTFRPAATFDSGGFGATAVTVRDVNQDGKPDLLVANSCQNIDFCSGTIGVLLGNGDGTFKTAKAYGAGGFYTDAVVVGDVNGDGKLDLIALNRCSEDECLTNGKVGVLLGNGNGTFKTAVSFDVGGLGPLSIAIHDVNGDNKLDLAVAMQCPENGPCGGSAIGVLLGNGDGSFEASVAYGSGGLSASSVGFEDVNRDGKPDLLVANECTISDPACIDGGDLSVLLGNGDGSFAPAITYASGGLNSTSIAAGDVTGDGRFDLLVTNFCNSGNDCTGSVAVLAGNGDGSFAGAAVYQPGGQSIFSLASQDVNGDGNLDLLAALQCSGGDGCTSGYGIGVLLGNSDGTFQSPVVYDSGGIGARSVALSDVNGDGKLDLLVGNECIADDDCTGAVGVLLGNGDGTFQAPMAYASGGQFGTSLKIADVNGDGKSDLLMTNQCADSNCTSSTVGVLLGNGDGTFQTVSTYSSGGYFAVSVNAGDVNGDGKIDLLVANQCAIGSNCATSGNVSVLLGAGGGVFQAPVSYASGGQFPYSVVLGDVNGDGNLDLLVVNQCADSVCENGSLGVLLGNGNGTFQPASSTTLPAFSSASLVLADFNGDGKLDVASSGGLLLMGNGDGTFQVPLALGVTGFGITLGDFNHDGRPDLALGGVVVFLNVSSRGVPTTTSLTSSLNPANFGQAVAFTARVAPIGATTPTGSITFRDGITVLGTMPLSNRHAIFNTSTLPAGSHSITANYSGDGNYLANSSPPLVEMVSASTTATTVSASALPVPLNQPVTYTATVSSQYGGDLTGPVTFKDGAKIIGTSSIAGNQASSSISYSVAGTHLITAAYSGDGSNTGSTSPALKVYVESQPLASNTAVTTSGSPSVIGQSVTFTATVGSNFGPIPDGGGVTFYDGATPLGNSLTMGGVAIFATSQLSAKTHTIKATYAGTATLKSSSGTAGQVVVNYMVKMSVTSTPDLSSYGQPVRLEAKVSSNAPGGPTGSVTFKDGNRTLGTAPLSAGRAILTTSNLPSGKAAIIASYNGDGYSAKSAQATTETVNPASTSASLASSLNPSPAGRIVEFTALVTSPTTLPTGTVTFMEGSAVLGARNLVQGKASYSTRILGAGTHTIVAIYGGTANIRGCTSGTVVQTVN